MLSANDQFYSYLPLNTIPLGQLFSHEQLFYSVPANWFVIISDIKGSTLAVKNGQHQYVNLIATGSVISVLNVAFGSGVTIPFFFGGDGATFIVPPTIVDEVMKALTIFKAHTLLGFKLELRIGSIAVKDIYAGRHELRIAKFSSTSIFAIPVVLGNGLSYAESLVKGENYEFPVNEPEDSEVNLKGMRCRWDNIGPPFDKEEIVSLLVVAREAAGQATAFGKVLNYLDDIYGLLQKRQPITVPKLKLKTSFNKLEAEVLAKLGRVRILLLLKTWFSAVNGFLFLRSKKGQVYMENLVKMSDTLIIDGRINTVISGTRLQREELQQMLDKLEAAGEIFYGLHVSRDSVMSCYVRDQNEDHIHFVDGSGGGYTQAATMLKTKIRKQQKT